MMSLILFIVAVLWIVAGAGLILETEATRRFYQERFPADKVHGYGYPVSGLGALLILGAFVSDRMFWWPFLIGLAACAKGVYLLRTDPERLQALLRYWYEEVPAGTLRLCGLLVYSLGAALLGYLF